MDRKWPAHDSRRRRKCRYHDIDYRTRTRKSTEGSAYIHDQGQGASQRHCASTPRLRSSSLASMPWELNKSQHFVRGHSTIIDDEIKESTLQGSSPSLCQARARSGRARPPGGDHDFTAALSPFRRLRRDPGPHRPAARAPSPGRRRRGRRRGLCPRPPVIDSS